MSTQIQDLITKFAAGGPLVAYAASHLSREQEQARPGPGQWSIAELVVHLLDSDLVGADRIKRVIAEENPNLLAYDENAWNDRLGAHEMPVEEAVNLFVANRQWMTHILKRCDEADFSRAGIHSETGRVTLAGLVAKYVGHVDHHLRFLYAKRSNLGVSVYPRYAGEQSV